MDELEAVVVLDTSHSAALLKLSKKQAKNSSVSEHVVITAGSKGVIRVLKISNMVSRNSLFYCIILCSSSKWLYIIWTRWGTILRNVQNQILSNLNDLTIPKYLHTSTLYLVLLPSTSLYYV